MATPRKPELDWLLQVQRAGSADELRDLFFQAPLAREEAASLLAQRATHWDEGLLLAVLSATPHLTHFLERQQQLPAWVLSRLVQWSVGRFFAESCNLTVQSAKKVLIALSSTEHFPPDGPDVQSLLRYLKSPEQGDHMEPTRRYVALDVAFLHAQLTEEMLGKIAPLLQAEQPGSIARDLQAPGCSMLAIRYALKELIRLEKHPELVQHFVTDPAPRRALPELRKALVEYAERNGFPVLLHALITDGQEDAVPLFRRLLRLDTSLAARALEEAGEHLLPHLTRRDLARLLASPDAAARLTAITHSTRVLTPPVRRSGAQKR